MQRGASKYYFKAGEKAAIIAYEHKRDYAKAFDLEVKLEKAAPSEDKRFDAQLGAMKAAYKLNRQDDVLIYANKVAQNPLAARDQVSIANFYIGKIAFDRNELPRAQDAFQKTIRNGGNDETTAEAKYLDALVEYKKRNLDVALDKAELASQNSPSVFWAAKATILQADIYAEKNDLVYARAALEAVINNVKDIPEVINEAKQKLQNLEAREKKKSRLNSDRPQSNLIEMDKNDGN
ncbi:MAG: hypothetical protein HC817_03405 [Saprospiraceae bacterium]|nr:hypothetical protein [Saprospiraceae bacterium]